MNEEKIRQLFEEIDPEGKIPQSKIDELVASMNDSSKLRDGDTKGGAIFHTIEQGLRSQLEEENDWRRKASIAAKIISLNLE
jgi:hypothetical protein